MAQEGDGAIDPDSVLQPGGALRGRLWQELSADLDRRQSLPVGTRIGAYAVLREIGRGGMGTVYLAERVDGQFEQRVAIKVLKTEADEVVRRFGQERRILASLQHPSIARLYDGGVTGDGRSYFVMEHVDGAPIDVYGREMPVEERLRLFIAVCEEGNIALNAPPVLKSMSRKLKILRSISRPTRLIVMVSPIFNPMSRAILRSKETSVGPR